MSVDPIARGLGARALTAIPNTIATRLKRSISRPGPRRLTDRPWITPPAYAALTLYRGGNRVTNSGNIYAAIIGGTSGAASAPTSTGAGFIADGGVTWMYVGPSYTSDADAPTYATSTSAPALGKFYRNASGNFASGAATVVSNDGWYNRLGYYGTQGSSIGNFMVGVAGGIEFETDSLSVAIVQSNASGDYGPNIEVDGRYLLDGSINQASTTGVTYTTVTFTSRKPRRIAVRWQTNTGVPVQGVYCEATAQVWAPALRDGGLKGLFIGDSFGVSNGAYYGEAPDRGIASQLFCELGIDNFFLDAIGGTGWTAGGAGNTYGDAARIAFITGFQPDVIVALLSVNDGGASQAALNAAQAAWLAAVRAVAPNAWIVILGTVSRNTGEATGEQRTRLYFASAGDSKLVFIPASGDAAGPWATGTGTVAAPSGSGSGDLYWGTDNVHPVARAQEYLGKRAGKAVKAYFASL